MKSTTIVVRRCFYGIINNYWSISIHQRRSAYLRVIWERLENQLSIDQLKNFQILYCSILAPHKRDSAPALTLPQSRAPALTLFSFPPAPNLESKKKVCQRFSSLFSRDVCGRSTKVRDWSFHLHICGFCLSLGVL